MASAELYDPVAGTWSSCSAQTATANCPAPLSTGRDNHTATLLASGKVLVAGGGGLAGALASSELYDPATGKWTSCSSNTAANAQCPGPMTRPRQLHTATRLTDGRVLVAGGAGGDGTTERYDPATGTWTSTFLGLNTPRGGHTATLLDRGDCRDNCGRVLVAGDAYANPAQQTAELFVPSLDLWMSTNKMNDGRREHTATLLPSGQVLAVGGSQQRQGTGDATLKRTERWNPVGELWTPAEPLADVRADHTAALLPNGKEVLVAGGTNPDGPLASAELYDIATDKWTKFPAPADRNNGGGTATVLPSGPLSACGTNCGKVLVTQVASRGADEPPSLASLYTPAPEVVKVRPASGPTTGGTPVTIEGSGLASVTSVKFGTAETTTVTHDPVSPDTKLVAASPPSPEGVVPVTVTSSGGTSLASDQLRFTYEPAAGGGGPAPGGGTPPPGGGTPPPGGGTPPPGGGTPPPGGGGSGATPGTGDRSARVLTAERARARGLRRCLSTSRRGRTGRLRRSARRRCLARFGRTPGRVRGLTARRASATKIVLTFRAPGSNGRRPPAARTYLVKQSLGPIRGRRGFRRARALCKGACRFSVTRIGERITLTITDRRPRTTYYYAVAALDNVSRRVGPRSRVVRARTP